MPRVWQDRIVQYPRRFKDQNNNTLTLTPDPGTISQEGTPVTAVLLNGIESDLAIIVQQQINLKRKIRMGGMV